MTNNKSYRSKLYSFETVPLMFYANTIPSAFPISPRQFLYLTDSLTQIGAQNITLHQQVTRQARLRYHK